MWRVEASVVSRAQKNQPRLDETSLFMKINVSLRRAVPSSEKGSSRREAVFILEILKGSFKTCVTLRSLLHTRLGLASMKQKLPVVISFSGADNRQIFKPGPASKLNESAQQCFLSAIFIECNDAAQPGPKKRSWAWQAQPWISELAQFVKTKACDLFPLSGDSVARVKGIRQALKLLLEQVSGRLPLVVAPAEPVG